MGGDVETIEPCRAHLGARPRLCRWRGAGKRGWAVIVNGTPLGSQPGAERLLQLGVRRMGKNMKSGMELSTFGRFAAVAAVALALGTGSATAATSTPARPAAAEQLVQRSAEALGGAARL